MSSAGLRDLRFGDGVRVTCSAGVAALAEGADSAALFAAADEALYEAKRRGKNRVVVARAGRARGTAARGRRCVAAALAQLELAQRRGGEGRREAVAVEHRRAGGR